METLKRLYAGLKLRINETKTAVARPEDRKFLGYSFWNQGETVKRRVAPKALDAMKKRVREITSRNGGRSMKWVFAELRSYLLGWKQYFRLADTPRTFREIDGWIRHRLRAMQLKQWKRGTTVFPQLRVRGISQHAAAMTASFAQSWWRASAHRVMNIALPTSYYDRMGVPRLAS